MKPLVDTVLFLVWVTVYLGAVSLVTRYRINVVHALGPSGRSEYRADKDVILWIIVFVLGLLLLFLAYLATKAVSQIL
jgi:NADH:ubiquinone oxidoreductase subunit 6 (subunit J)